MMAFIVVACGAVLIAAGVLWLKPWIDDYGEISDWRCVCSSARRDRHGAAAV